MPIYGVKSSLGLVFQNSFDTIGDLTNSTTNFAYLSENLTTNLEDILSEQIEGVYDEKERYRGQQHVSGDIEVEAGAKSIGMFLHSIMDNDSLATSDSIYTHNFIPRQSEAKNLCWHRPITISKSSDSSEGNKQNLYNLCATNIEFSLENGGFLKAKVSYVGGINNDSTTAVTNAYLSSDELFTWDASSLAIGGNGIKATSISISLTDPVEPQFTLANSYWPRSNNLTGFRDVTFNMTLPWNNNSDYNYFFNSTKTSEMTFLCKGATEIQSGYTNQIKFSLWDIVYETFEASAGGPGEVELSISGRAQYNESESKSFNVELINLQSAYV